MSTPRPLDLALRHIADGIAVVPVEYKGKRPWHEGKPLTDWQHLRVTAETACVYFNGKAQNVGGLWGEPSGWLTDVDLDSPEAIRLAPHFLRPTRTWGRASKPRSHWLYRQATNRVPTVKFQDPDGGMHLEWRAGGAQTVLPGSIHESGERVEDVDAREALEVDGRETVASLHLFAAACILLRRWKPGGQDDLAAALAGSLLRAKWEPEKVDRLIGIIADEAGDREARKRLKALGLAEKLATKAGRVPGLQKLKEVVGDATVSRLAELLDLRPGFTPDGVTAADLQRMDIPPIQWVVPDLLPEGVVLLAGRPKLGKSWLVLNVGTAAAYGGRVLGWVDVPQRVGVAYLALEDGKRRLKDRMRRITKDGDAWPDELHFFTSWDKGNVLALRDWLRERPHVRLIIIDTLAKFRAYFRDRDGNAYMSDYAALEPLKELATELGICVLIVHHTRKSGADDVFDTVSGTLGLTGAADATLVLQRARGADEAVLHVTGRDVEEKELGLKWDRAICSWSVLGPAQRGVLLSAERRAVLDALVRFGPMTPREVALVLGQPQNNVRQLLHKMSQDGVVVPIDGGRYGPANDEF